MISNGLALKAWEIPFDQTKQLDGPRELQSWLSANRAGKRRFCWQLVLIAELLASRKARNYSGPFAFVWIARMLVLLCFSQGMFVTLSENPEKLDGPSSPCANIPYTLIGLD